MTTRGLMVGNKIGMQLKKHPNNIFTVVEVGETMKCIDHDDMDSLGFWNIGDFEPIPLTPEILEKCGFKNLHFEYCDGLRLTPIMIEFIPDSTISVRIELHEDGEAFVIDRSKFYLHQLQNLFFSLSGEELTVKI